MSNARPFLLPLLIFTVCMRAGAQEKDKVVILNHADSLVGAELNGERVKQLIGNVQFTQGNVVVHCRKAVQYLASNKISLEGEVEVLDSTMRMVGDHGMYYQDERVAEAYDRVMIEDGSTTVKADSGRYLVPKKIAIFRSHVFVEDSGSVLTANALTYYRDPQQSVATGNVVITNKSNGLKISGEHFDNYRRRGYSRMTEHPRVMQVDTAGGKADTLFVTGEVLESYNDSAGTMIASDSVTVSRGDVQAEAGNAVFYTRADSIILRRTPFVWYISDSAQANQISGDSIFLRLERRKLRTAYVRGHACAISEADTLFPNRLNQMTGQEMVIAFDSSRIRQIDDRKTATSLYYLFDERKPNGVNKTSGDQVVITFRGGKVDKLKVVGSVEGQYIPERQVEGREKEYNLPGFNWRAGHIERHRRGRLQTASQ